MQGVHNSRLSLYSTQRTVQRMQGWSRDHPEQYHNQHRSRRSGYTSYMGCSQARQGTIAEDYPTVHRKYLHKQSQNKQ